MLPLTITQRDLPSLKHTNAEVLGFLLESRNRSYYPTVDAYGKRLSETDLLSKLAKMNIRILIDAGAQILEHDNKSLVKEWLLEDPEAVAAVYFDDDHRPMVLYQKGSTVPLLASPYAEKLEDCLVYLDESHCRGTDLKLPPFAKAGLTLGPHLIKDALAQAAMRLRLLGETQSVVFFSPPEVHQSILDVQKKGKSGFLDSYDVICWLLVQTVITLEQLEPLYFTQGMDYCRRLQSRLDYPEFLTDERQLKSYLKAVKSKELQTLAQLYEPRRQAPIAQSRNFAPSLVGHVATLNQRRKAFQDRGLAVHATALEEVEQEREVEFEVESVRELHHPHHFKSLMFPGLNKDIQTFIETGRLPAGSDSYQPAFYMLQRTAIGLKHDIRIQSMTHGRLFVSTEFTRTVKLEEPNDNFLRPVQWVLFSTSTQTALVIIPEEANLAIPILHRVGTPLTHLIVYAAPVTRRMIQFNRLNYYTIPSLPRGWKAPIWLQVHIGVFAGRLYFEWEEHSELMKLVGGASSESETSGQCFAKKPLTFLHDWLAVRRKGQDFEHTPMGFITTGKPLTAEHSFFRSSIEEGAKVAVENKSIELSNGATYDDDGNDSGSEDDYHDAEDGDDGNDSDDDSGDFDEGEKEFFAAGEYVPAEGGNE